MDAEDLQALKRARQLITPPECWTQKAFARDDQGNLCGALFERAVCWCATGALIKEGALRALEPLREAAKTRGYDAVIQINDTTDHATVLATFDQVIEAEEAKTKEIA